MPPAGVNVPPTPISARDWLNTTDLPHLIEQAITPPIHDMWMQGYLVGTRSAAAVYENVAGGGDPRDPAVRIEVDWGRWQPGDVAAARKIMAEDGSIDGWLAMLRDHNVVIKGIADHRLDDIAAVLADGLEQGRSIDDIAAALNGVVGNVKRARNIAHTETARAIGAATLDSYVSMDVAASSWMTAFDQWVCPACWENEFESLGVVRVVPIGQRYPSGDYHPPAHPGGCRCALVPVLAVPNEQLLLVKALSWQDWNLANPDRPKDSDGRWTDGLPASGPTYWRVQAGERDLSDLLDPQFQVSRVWGGDDGFRDDEGRARSDRAGVSVCDSRESLACYLATSGIPFGKSGWVLVEVEGDISDDRPFDADAGELLVHPTRIVSAGLIDDEFFDMVGAAYDAQEGNAMYLKTATIINLHRLARPDLVKGRRKATPGSGMTVAAWNVANPDHPKDAEGRWADAGDRYIRVLGARDSGKRRESQQQLHELFSGVIRETGSEGTPLANALLAIMNTRSEGARPKARAAAPKDPARPLTSTNKPERAAKPAAAQVVAEIDAIIDRPMSSDRDRLAELLSTMTLPQLKEFAERRSHVLQAGVKKTKINRLVENMIGHRLNSESIRFASFEDYTGGRRRKRLDEIRARLRELDAIGPAGREEYGRLHHERLELITGGAGADEMAEFRQRAGSPIPADRPTRSVRGRVNPAVGGQFRDAPDPARPLTASGTSRVAQPETALDRPDPPAEAAEVAANVTDAVSQFPAGKYDTNIRSIMSGDDLSSDANRDRARQLRRIADNADQVADMRWANSALNRPGDKERRASAEDDWMRAAKLRELADALDQLAAATERLPGGGADPKV